MFSSGKSAFIQISFALLVKVSFLFCCFQDFFPLEFSFQYFDYHVSWGLLVTHPPSAICRFMSFAKFGTFSLLFPYELFQPCSFLFPQWTSTDTKRGGYMAPHYCWAVLGILSPHMISVTTGDVFHYHSAELKVPARYSDLCSVSETELG